MKAKIRFYFAMASLIDAGLPVTQALRQHLPASFRKLANSLADDIEKGRGQLHDLMMEHPEKFSVFECNIVKIGENTGHLENSFKVLAEFYQERLELTSNLISGLIYPAFIYHFAAVVIPFISFITNSCSLIGVAIRIILSLGIPYSICLAFFLYFWLQKRFQLPPPLFLSNFMISIPIFGSLIRKINYSRFFHAYGIAISTGLYAGDGVLLAADSCSNSWIKNSFIKTANEIKTRNCPFYEALRENIYHRDRESIAVQIMENGEVSGKSDASAAKIAAIYREESQTALKIIVAIVPKLVYLCIALYIAWKIVTFWSGIFARTTTI